MNDTPQDRGHDSHRLRRVTGWAKRKLNLGRHELRDEVDRLEQQVTIVEHQLRERGGRFAERVANLGKRLLEGNRQDSSRLHVEQVMTAPVWTCSPYAPLAEAARIMWERDTGFVPVVDHDGVPVGVLTDRDLCMAAYTQGRTLSVVYAEAVMSKPVQVCHSHDTVAEALGRMQAARVRRLPVVDEHEHIVGVIALGDVARLSTGVDESGASGVVEPTGVDELGLRVVGVLAAISEPWLPHPRRTASEPSAHPDEPAQPSPPPPPPS